VDFLPDGGEDSRCESGAFDDEEEPPDAFSGVQDSMGRWIATGALAE
jgi:hypothetical protein